MVTFITLFFYPPVVFSNKLTSDNRVKKLATIYVVSSHNWRSVCFFLPVKISWVSFFFFFLPSILVAWFYTQTFDHKFSKLFVLLSRRMLSSLSKVFFSELFRHLRPFLSYLLRAFTAFVIISSLRRAFLSFFITHDSFSYRFQASNVLSELSRPLNPSSRASSELYTCFSSLVGPYLELFWSYCVLQIQKRLFFSFFPVLHCFLFINIVFWLDVDGAFLLSFWPHSN